MGDYIFGGGLKADNIKLYTQDGGEIYDLGSGDCELLAPLSADEEPPAYLSFSTSQPIEFTCENSYVNRDLLERLMPHGTKYGVLGCFEVPIMIQARWHKKKRINKKWLKRYGMKPDTIKTTMNIRELTYEPWHIIGKDETGIYSTFNSWHFETDMPIYKYRPDQMRKNLKIQW